MKLRDAVWLHSTIKLCLAKHAVSYEPFSVAVCRRVVTGALLREFRRDDDNAARDTRNSNVSIRAANTVGASGRR